jgi:hypothetical protein
MMPTDVSEVLTTSIIKSLTMEAVGTSETSVNMYQATRSNISEDSHLYTRRRENLKSHQIFYGLHIETAGWLL